MSRRRISPFASEEDQKRAYWRQARRMIDGFSDQHQLVLSSDTTVDAEIQALVDSPEVVESAASKRSGKKGDDTNRSSKRRNDFIRAMGAKKAKRDRTKNHMTSCSVEFFEDFTLAENAKDIRQAVEKLKHKLENFNAEVG